MKVRRIIKEFVWRPKWERACQECLPEGVETPDPPPVVRAILSEEAPEQGSLGWLLQRMEVDETGSGIKHAVNCELNPDYSKKHWMVKTGRSGPVVSNRHMKRGTRNEWRIRVISARWFGCVVAELPMLRVGGGGPASARLGCSPDGLAVHRDGSWCMHEYKCPAEINTAKLRDYYWHQCQLEMESTGARVCWLIGMNFHDEFSADVSDEAVKDFLALRIPHDSTWRATIEPMVRAYSDSVAADRARTGLGAQEIHERHVLDRLVFGDMFELLCSQGMEEEEAQKAAEEVMQREHLKWFRQRTGMEALDVDWGRTPMRR